MPNKQYIAGRALEYAVMDYWRKQGYTVVRSAGSHGEWDVMAVKEDRPVDLIQCKRVDTAAAEKRMIASFKSNPPLTPSNHYHFVLVTKVKGKKEFTTTTV